MPHGTTPTSRNALGDKYKIVGKIPIPCDDLMEWAYWYEQAGAERIVCQETIGGYWVSTVFLALDHSFGDGPPLLFETMIFHHTKTRHEPADDAPMFRAPTWEMALENHEKAVRWAETHMP